MFLVFTILGWVWRTVSDPLSFPERNDGPQTGLDHMITVPGRVVLDYTSGFV